MKKINRRKYLRRGLLVTSLVASKVVRAKTCFLTPAQTEGSFYPIEDQEDKDSDLTLVRGRSLKAEGSVVVVRGVVIDEDCKAVEGALVEIWQACASGKYNHPGDSNPAKLDPNFQYWGRAVTDNQGRYSFKTIKPGAYQATAEWIRPPHIHLKVHRRGYEELTTQMYFKNNMYNKGDRILQTLSREERASVVIDFKDGVGELNLSIRSI